MLPLLSKKTAFIFAAMALVVSAFAQERAIIRYNPGTPNTAVSQISVDTSGTTKVVVRVPSTSYVSSKEGITSSTIFLGRDAYLSDLRDNITGIVGAVAGGANSWGIASLATGSGGKAGYFNGVGIGVEGVSSSGTAVYANGATILGANSGDDTTINGDTVSMPNVPAGVVTRLMGLTAGDDVATTTSVERFIGGPFLRTDKSNYLTGATPLQNEGTYQTRGGDARPVTATDLQAYRTDPSYVASGDYSGVFSGEDNRALDQYSIAVGGISNVADGYAAVVGGGANNNATESGAVVAGGGSNIASGLYSTVSGGETNTASGENSTVSGGETNGASASHSVVSGGFTNTASGANSFVGAGANNTASGVKAVVVGGETNTAGTGEGAAVVGGQNNEATADFSFVGGGENNQATGPHSVSVGGFGGVASGDYSSALGGFGAGASGQYAVALGGFSSTASGDFSVAAGRGSTASGGSSFAVGYNANATHDGSVTISADSAGTGGSSAAADTFNVFAPTGLFFTGARFNIDSLPTTGGTKIVLQKSNNDLATTTSIAGFLPSNIVTTDAPAEQTIDNGIASLTTITPWSPFTAGTGTNDIAAGSWALNENEYAFAYFPWLTEGTVITHVRVWADTGGVGIIKLNFVSKTECNPWNEDLEVEVGEDVCVEYDIELVSPVTVQPNTTYAVKVTCVTEDPCSVYMTGLRLTKRPL